jgi:hypothetical protein
MLTIETEVDALFRACGRDPSPGSYFGAALGVAKDGRFRHRLTLMRFDVTPGWCVRGTQPPDGGAIAVLVNSDFPHVYAAVWMGRDKTPLS